LFTEVLQQEYLGANEREHLWQSKEDPNCLLSGALLGGEIIRLRLLYGNESSQILRSFQDNRAHMFRYQLADGGPGTLPYHSWVVSRGDEEWSSSLSEAQIRATIEPYLHGFAFSDATLRLTRSLASEERIFGLGERTGTMNKRGQAFPIWNIDPHKGHNPTTETMYASIPFYLGLSNAEGNAYGVLIDHTGRTEMDIGRTDRNAVQMTIQADSLVVYFLVGPAPRDVMRQYTELTGHMPLPPRWTLGHHQCRWSYASEQAVRDVASQLRARNHPCDAIWLDIDYMQGFRNFTWNPDAFPNPAQLTHDLHAQGLHLVTILDPGTKIDERYFVYQQGMEHDYFCRLENGMIFSGNVWPGASVFPDFSQSKVRTWWGNLYQGLLDQGVDAIWNDMNEPAVTDMMILNDPTIPSPTTKSNTMADDVLHVAAKDQPLGPDGPPTLHKFFHNAYGMEMARATYEGLLRLRPGQRPFVLTRSGTAGIQRYAALWTGDNTSQWADIPMAITMCLNIGMSGVPFTGVDIGGFWEASNGELLIRFAQLSALFPFCRNHNAQENPDQEPWAFGEPFESAYRAAIETRYRLLPYLYTLFQQAAASGAPIIRPLYFHYPQDEQACDVEDTFLVGDALLSAPIYTQGATSRRVYIPSGTWIDFWNGNEYAGAGWSDIEASLDRWPLLVRGNSILPTGPLMQYIGQYPTDPLTFTCYMATDGLASYTLYEDDGSTLAYQQGAFAETSISCRVTPDFITVEIEERFDAYRPQRETYEVILYVGGKTLRQSAKAGQGKIVIRL
jgi:alpha-glucosidase